MILKKTLAQCFPVNFARFLRTPFLQNTSGRLLLYIETSQMIFTAIDFTGSYKTETLGFFRMLYDALREKGPCSEFF